LSHKSISRIEESLEKLPKLGEITVMIDYFVDRFVRIKNLNELVALVKKKGKAGGGSVRGINQTEVKGGNAVNMGYALGVFRANVNLVAIASSLPAEMLSSTFRKLPNVNMQIVEGKPGYTVAFEFKEKGRHVNVMISETGDLNRFDGTKLSRENLDSVARSEIVAMVNWAANTKGNELCAKVFTLAKRHGAKTFFDPADVSGLEERLVGLKQMVFDKGLVDYVSLNENEARVISKVLFKNNLPHTFSHEDLKKTAAILSEGTGSTVDLHTRELSVCARGNDIVSQNCYRVQQKTITGAGDVWAAADLAGYLTKLQDSDRLQFANSAAGLYVSRISAISPSLKEIFRFMRDNRVH
jgi:ribokinase